MDEKITIIFEDEKDFDDSVSNFTFTKLIGTFVLILSALFFAIFTFKAIQILSNDHVDGAITTECLIQAYYYKSMFAKVCFFLWKISMMNHFFRRLGS